MLGVLLAPDGVEVEACTTAADACRLPLRFKIAALVVDARLPDGEGTAVVTTLRARGNLPQASPVVVLVERADGPARRQIEALGATLRTKPPSLLDIADLIRSALPVVQAAAGSDPSDDPDSDAPVYFLPAPQPGPPDPVSETPKPVPTGARTEPRLRPEAARGRRTWSMANARMLTRLWVRKATGVLRVEGGASPAWVLLSGGGPVGPNGVAAVDEALSGGEISLDPCEVDEPGDRVALARLVWRAAREAVAGESVLALVPAGNVLTDGAAELPLTAATRRCLLRLGGVSVQGLARREGAPVDDVAVDLAALRWLGLVGLRDPGTPEPVADPPSQNLVPIRRAPEGSCDPASVTRRDHFGDILGVKAEPPRRADAAPPPVERVDDPVTSSTASIVPVARLRREVDILRTADAWTVLGIPRRSPLDMVRASASRMKHRYRAMDKDPNPEARELAAEIFARIEAAETELLTGRASSAEPVFEGLLRGGLAAIAAKDWARADRILSQARQHAPDSAIAVAHLGWARFQNPEEPVESREEDGADFVELALQFDINCAQAWAYRGEIATCRGDTEEARQCFSTAAKLDPALIRLARR
jgi:CheY-like chemotaxis protein